MHFCLSPFKTTKTSFVLYISNFSLSFFSSFCYATNKDHLCSAVLSVVFGHSFYQCVLWFSVLFFSAFQLSFLSWISCMWDMNDVVIIHRQTVELRKLSLMCFSVLSAQYLAGYCISDWKSYQSGANFYSHMLLI